METRVPQTSYKRAFWAWLSIFSTVVSLLWFDPAAAQPARPSVTATELESEIAKRLARVPEFRFIREEAAKLGVKIYLFGGTAAGFAHYVKWDLLREKGDSRYQKNRFDYDFTNVYRSTQDLDIVIDGTAQQAAVLRERLKRVYPHFQGIKDQWEVRLLREKMGSKEALLENPDFLRQHTDSNSTGMIEVTTTNPRETVRDLRDWNSGEPQFLRDVAEGRIHFYFSSGHETTSRAVEGKNPPIFSVIRYLTKAFQYELEMRPEEVATVRAIIDSMKIGNDGYVGTWIEENGKKLVRHAVNIEYAIRTLDELGLRSKLVALKGDAKYQGTLAWWLSKEPLRTKPIGVGSGKTARELGITLVAHETSDLMALESMTRAHTGDPNVLISRDGVAGEAAVSGNGFYTRRGREGARGTGLTIRFRVHPDARSGTDFFVTDGDYVIFKNKAALRVVPETLNIDYYEFYKLLASADPSDRGTLERLRGRFKNQGAALTDREIDRIAELVKSQKPLGITHARLEGNPIIFEWLSGPLAARRPEVTRWIDAANVDPASVLKSLIGSDIADAVLLDRIDEFVKRNDPRVDEALVHRFFGHKPLEKTWTSDARAGGWIQRLYSPETIDKLGAMDKFGKFPGRVWNAKGTDGKSLLEKRLLLTENDLVKMDLLEGIVSLEPSESRRLYEIWRERSKGMRLYGEDSFASIMKMELRFGTAGTFLNSFKSFAMISEYLKSDKMQALLEEALEKTFVDDPKRSLLIQGLLESKLDLVRDAYPKAYFEYMTTTFIPKYVPHKMAEFVSKFPTEEFAVDFIMASKDSAIRDLRVASLKEIVILAHPRVPAEKVNAMIVSLYRDDSSKFPEKGRLEYIHQYTNNHKYFAAGEALVASLGPKAALPYFETHFQWLVDPAHHNYAEFGHRQHLLRVLVDDPAWQNPSQWLPEYAAALVERFASLDERLGEYGQRVDSLAMILETFGPKMEPGTWRNHAGILRSLVGRGVDFDRFVIETFISDPILMRDHGHVVDKLIGREYDPNYRKGRSEESKLRYGKPTPGPGFEVVIEAMVKLIQRPESATHPEWFEFVINQKSKIDKGVYASLFQLPHWRSHPVLLRMQTLSKKNASPTLDVLKMEAAISKPHFRRVVDFKTAPPTFTERLRTRIDSARAFVRGAPVSCPQVFGGR